MTARLAPAVAAFACGAAAALGVEHAMVTIATRHAGPPVDHATSGVPATGNGDARRGHDAREPGTGISPAAVPLGMRAVVVPVHDAAAFTPGSRVDVVVTFGDDGIEANGRTPLARTVVGNAEVLEAPRLVSGAGEAAASGSVVLAVRPGEAERLALGSAHGRVTLALRGPIDTLPAGGRTVTLPALLQEATPVAPPREGPPTVVMRTVVTPAPTAAAPAYEVEAIRGARRTDETVR